MTALDFDSCYRAIASRDARFDGQFYTAVSSTGIYCRPSCPALTPKAANVTFHTTAAAAQAAGYRACRRCLPDAVPGSPRWNINSDLASRAMRLISDGVVERDGVPGLAAQLGYSERQLGRVLTEELGAGPLALARAHRATNARLLIQSTTMTFADVAFAAGYASIRQFNDSIREVFAQTPTELRSKGRSSDRPTGGSVTLKLPFRQPFSVQWLQWFLLAHAAIGVEQFLGNTYRRSVLLPRGPAIISVDFGTAARGYLTCQLQLASMADLSVAVSRTRHLLDLDADPVAVDAALSHDDALAPLIAATPGIRALGTVDPHELLIRTMIGQQISISAALTHITRLSAALGTTLAEPSGSVTHLFPTAAAVAEYGGEVLTGPRARIAAITGAAAALASGELVLHAGLSKTQARERLMALKGVGAWTADYVTMRLIADPDTVLATDLVVRKSAESLHLSLTPSHWSPWGSYACMHLWNYWITTEGHRQ